jgi:hypothetical protein
MIWTLNRLKNGLEKIHRATHFVVQATVREQDNQLPVSAANASWTGAGASVSVSGTEDDNEEEGVDEYDHDSGTLNAAANTSHRRYVPFIAERKIENDNEHEYEYEHEYDRKTNAHTPHAR